MPTPPVEDFDEALTFASSPFAVIQPLEGESGAQYSMNEVIDLYKSWREMARSRYQRLTQFPAIEWLHSQRDFHRADAKVNRPRGKADQFGNETSEQFSRRMAESLWNSAAAHRPTDPTIEVIRRIAVRGSFGFSSYWLVNILSALREYFYSDTADTVLHTVKRFNEAAAEMESVARRLAAASNEIEAMGFPGLRRLPSARYRRIAEDGISQIDPSVLPIRRNDAHSRERVFVYRVWMANKRWTSNPKTDAIADLMCIEGIKHQYDTRNIEKLCQNFSAISSRLKSHELAG